MVQASIRAFGPLAGGPDQIHLALKDVLTADGTLMMYASVPEHYDEVGRGNLAAEQEREILQRLPAFDPLTVRSCRDNGALVELLRTWPGSIVNHHVARFVAWGRHVPYLFSHQPWNYAYGRGSARGTGFHGDVSLFADRRRARRALPASGGHSRRRCPAKGMTSSWRTGPAARRPRSCHESTGVRSVGRLRSLRDRTR